MTGALGGQRARQKAAAANCLGSADRRALVRRGSGGVGGARVGGGRWWWCLEGAGTREGGVVHVCLAGVESKSFGLGDAGLATAGEAGG